MKALFYPNPLTAKHSLHFILSYMGIEYTNDPDTPHDFGFLWSNNNTTSWYCPHFMQHGPYINNECVNTGKDYVDEVHKDTFGYSMGIDPERFKGYAVRKSVKQYAKDGAVVRCPLTPDKGFVYQLLIDTRVSATHIRDVRVIIIDSKPQLIWVKKKEVTSLFTGKILEAEMQKPEEEFSTDELNDIKWFCINLGLEYGELDILRNNSDGRIFIVDANNTPGINLLKFLDDQRKKQVITTMADGLLTLIKAKIK